MNEHICKVVQYDKLAVISLIHSKMMYPGVSFQRRFKDIFILCLQFSLKWDNVQQQLLRKWKNVDKQILQIQKFRPKSRLKQAKCFVNYFKGFFFYFRFRTGLNQFGPAYVAFLSVRMTGYLKMFSTTLIFSSLNSLYFLLMTEKINFQALT